MYEFVGLVKTKGLTVKQDQKLFIDCADMILDTKINSNDNESDDIRSDIDRSCSELDKLDIYLIVYLLQKTL